MRLHFRSNHAGARDTIEVADDGDHPIYCISKRLFPIDELLHLTRADGEDVALIACQPEGLHETRYLDMYNGVCARMDTALTGPDRDAFPIDELDWLIRYDARTGQYEVCDEKDDVLALVSAPGEVEIYDEEQADLIVAVLLLANPVEEERLLPEFLLYEPAGHESGEAWA